MRSHLLALTVMSLACVLPAVEQPAAACVALREPPRPAAPATAPLGITHAIYSGRPSPHWSVGPERDKARLRGALARAIASGRPVAKASQGSLSCGLGAYLIADGHTALLARRQGTRAKAPRSPVQVVFYTLCPNGTLIRDTLKDAPVRIRSKEAWTLGAGQVRALRRILATSRTP